MGDDVILLMYRIPLLLVFLLLGSVSVLGFNEQFSENGQVVMDILYDKPVFDRIDGLQTHFGYKITTRGVKGEWDLLACPSASRDNLRQDEKDSLQNVVLTSERGDPTLPSSIDMSGGCVSFSFSAASGDRFKIGSDSVVISIENGTATFSVTPENKKCTYLKCESDIILHNLEAENITITTLDVQASIENSVGHYLIAKNIPLTGSMFDQITNTTIQVPYIGDVETSQNVSITISANESVTFTLHTWFSEPLTSNKYNVSLFLDQEYKIDPFFNTTDSDFLDGDFNGTQLFLNVSGFVQINLTNFLNGTYNSEIFDGFVESTWVNISWTDINSFDRVNATEFDLLLLYHLDQQTEFGENTTHVFDFTFNGQNASCDLAGSQCPVLSNDSIRGGSYDFDGNDFFSTIESSPLLNFTDQSFSVGAFYKTTSGSSSNIMSRFSVRGFELQLDPNNAVFHLRDGSDNFLTGSTTVNDGEFHLIIATYNATSNEAKLYVDGFIDAVPLSIVGGNDFSDENAKYAVGADFGGGNPYTGLIDVVGVFNKTLSNDEINRLYDLAFLKLNMSVRSCDDALCDNETFEGNFNTGFENLNISPNRYFQFQSRFFSTDSGETPRLRNVNIGFNSGVVVPPVAPTNDTLVIGVCPTSTGGVLLLWLLVLMSLAFITIALIHSLGFIGFFGGLMMMVSSWYIGACVNFFAILMAFIGLVLMIYFVVTNIGFRNETFK